MTAVTNGVGRLLPPCMFRVGHLRFLGGVVPPLTPGHRRGRDPGVFPHQDRLPAGREKTLAARREALACEGKKSCCNDTIMPNNPPKGAGLGDKDKAMEWLEKAYEERSFLTWLKVDPVFDPLRDDSRFISFLGKLGLGRN